jgi:WD40 repeat protein
MHRHEEVYWISKESGQQARVLDLLAAAAGWKAWGEGPFSDSQIGDVWFSPDGAWVAVQRYIGDPILLHVWGTRTERWRHFEPADEHCFCVDAAVFSPDSRILVFASGTDGGGTRWLERRRLAPGRRLAPLEFPGYTVKYLAFSPDERRLAAATFGGVYLYEPQRAAVHPVAAELSLEDEPGPICFHPDGKELAILHCEDVLFWDGRASEAELVAPGAGMILTLAWSPDGRVLVLGCKDGTVRFWDRQIGGQTSCYDWGIGAVSSVAFAPDGMTGAAGGEKGEIVVWDVAD